MALSYRARRRLSLLILLVGMPAYIVVAVTLLNWADRQFGRLPIAAEVTVYVILGFLWALPFRTVFRGVGQADPEARPGGNAGTGNAETTRGRPEDRPDT